MLSVEGGMRAAGTYGDDTPISADDHQWWYHRTFRERAPGGFARRSVRGFRSKNRPIGRRKGNAREDFRPYILAIILISLAEIPPKPGGSPNYYLAAQVAVLQCEDMDYLPGVFATLIAKEAQEREDKESRERGLLIPNRRKASLDEDKAVLARVRLIHRALISEAKRGLLGHITWLQTQSDILTQLAATARQLVAEELSEAEVLASR